MGTTNPNFDTATQPTPLGYSSKEYILVPWLKKMFIGSGYDSVSHAVLSSAAADEFALEEVPQGEGQTGELKIKQVQSIEEVRNLISLQSDLKVGYDVFSGTAVGRFLKERRMNKFSLYFLVLSYMERTLVRVKGLKLSAEARRLAQDPAAFRSVYGDYCVEGYIAGGYLIGLAELQVTSKQVLDEVQAKVGGKYDALVTVDAGLETAWTNLERTAGTDFSLQVIHAGLGEGIRAYAMPGQGGGSGTWGETPRVPTGGQGGGASTASAGRTGSNSRVNSDIRREDNSPSKTRDAGTVSPVIPKSLTQAWDDGGDDDPDDGSEEEAIAPNIPADARPSNDRSGNGGSLTGTGSPLSPIVNQLPEPTAEYIPALKMNLDGMLKAASALQAQSGLYRVRLLAHLKPLSTLEGGPGSGGPIDIHLKDIDGKRKMLSEYYSKASFIHDSVRYALESRGQFAAKESALSAIMKEMELLMDGYTKLWDELKTSPQTVTFDRIGNGPDESKIPKWAVKKDLFQPVSKELDPQLFVNIVNKSVDQALAIGIPERREALKDYLKLVQESGGKNYANAILALETLSEALPDLDEQPARRNKEIKSMATMVNRSMRAWAIDSTEIQEKFNSLDGKAGLDQKQLEFLGPLNAIVFGGAENARYGFKAFWRKLHDELEILVQKSAGWTENQKLTDIIDYSNDWSNQAEAFKSSSQELIVKIRRKLL